MRQKLEGLKQEAKEAAASADHIQSLLAAQKQFLGKKGSVTLLVKSLGKLSAEERPEAGKLLTGFKKEIEALFSVRKKALEGDVLSERWEKEYLDLSLPGRGKLFARRHPLSLVMSEIIHIFSQVGFTVETGSEIETDYYNFEALNFPPDHPARNMQDTLFLEDGRLLRTHTSSVQIRVMEEREPPLRFLSPGRVHRSDEADATHSYFFYQVEGLWVEEGITMSHLFGVLSYFLKRFFGDESQVQFRPSFFPFTEPSTEVYVSCMICRKNHEEPAILKDPSPNCKVCGGTGWVEVMGAGLVDPNVFRSVRYSPERVNGFAFGMGVERMTMLRYGIYDMRLFYQNDVRFLGGGKV